MSSAPPPDILALLGPPPPNTHLDYFCGGIGYVRDKWSPNYLHRDSVATIVTKSVAVEQIHPMVAPFFANPLVTPKPTPSPSVPNPLPSPSKPIENSEPKKLQRILPLAVSSTPKSTGICEAVTMLQGGGKGKGPSRLNEPDPAETAFQKSLERLRRREAEKQPFQMDPLLRDMQEFGEGMQEAICEGRHDPSSALKKGADPRVAADIVASGNGPQALVQGAEWVANHISESEHLLVEGDPHDKGRAVVELTGDMLAAASTSKLLSGKTVKAVIKTVSQAAEQICDKNDSLTSAKIEVTKAACALREELVTSPETIFQIEDAGPNGNITLPAGWHKHEFQGEIFYQVDPLIDTTTVDRRPILHGASNPTYGWTNLERMASGYPPIGADGQPLRVQQILNGKKKVYVEVLDSTPRPGDLAHDLLLAKEANYWRSRIKR